MSHPPGTNPRPHLAGVFVFRKVTIMYRLMWNGTPTPEVVAPLETRIWVDPTLARRTANRAFGQVTRTAEWWNTTYSFGTKEFPPTMFVWQYAAKKHFAILAPKLSTEFREFIQMWAVGYEGALRRWVERCRAHAGCPTVCDFNDADFDVLADTFRERGHSIHYCRGGINIDGVYYTRKVLLSV